MKHHSHSEIFIENEEAGVQAQLIETQPQEPRQPINRCHRCVRNIPYFTLIQSLLVAIFYSLGIYGIVGTKIDLSLQPLGLHGPQSPSCIGSDKLCQYEYFKVGSFPGTPQTSYNNTPIQHKPPQSMNPLNSIKR